MSSIVLTELRAEITRLCDNLAFGRVSIEEVFNLAGDNSAHSASTYVYVVKLIERIPDVGKVKARKILAGMSLSERCRVGELSSEQRSHIINQVTRL